jgi:hypothetical protein
MNPTEALNLLYVASRKLDADADVHDKLREAAGVLQKALTAPPEKGKKKKTMKKRKDEPSVVKSSGS